MDDSRLKGHTRRVTHPTLPLERTFCAQCGKPRGWVTQESMDHIRAQQVLVLCDDCEEAMSKQLGPIPLKRAPIQEVKGE